MLTGARLASLLASQLRAVAPEGFAVESDGGDVTISRGDSRLQVHVSGISGDSGATRQVVADASLATIDNIQDFITRELGTPWPSGDPPQLALPFVEWQGDQLRLLYGDPAQPTLELKGIASSDLWV